MKMKILKNKKGFVLTETLVVAVFLVTIFTFIYTTVIPLIGKYKDMAERESDIGIVYKLYHIRKMIADDENRNVIMYGEPKRITCSDFSDATYCNNLMNYLGLDEYVLIHVAGVEDNLDTIRSINSEIADYVSSMNDDGNLIVLLDLKTHTIAHLKFVEAFR